MNGINVDEEGDVDSRLRDVQQQLSEAKSREQELREQFQERESQLQTVEQDARAQKKRHLDQMRNASQTISGLKAEVEAKSNNIAFLTTEIHRLKMQHRATMPVPGGGGQMAEQGGVGVGTIVRRSQPQLGHLPMPPRELLAHSGRARHGGTQAPSNPTIRRVAVPHSSTSNTSLASGLSTEVGGDLFARSIHHPVSASTRSMSSGSESPDITPFVQRPEVEKLEVKKSAPLPPINSAHVSNPSSAGPSSVPAGIGERNVRIVDGEVRQVLISSKKRASIRTLSRARPSTPEVATLAVDQVNSENKNWNRPSESHSSEYN